MTNWPESDRETVMHDGDDLCINHCGWCHLDQHFSHAWRWCGECGHGYRTKRDLVTAYRRSVLPLLPPGGRRPWLFSNKFDDSVAITLWHRLKIRAARINFCPLCAHDW